MAVPCVGVEEPRPVKSLNLRAPLPPRVNRTVAALLALLAVLSLGAAAATLDATVAPGGSGGTGDADGVGAGSGDRVDLGQPAPPDRTVQTPGIPPVVYQVLLLVVALVVLAGLVQFLQEYGARGLVTVTLVGVVMAVLLFLLLGGVGGGGSALGTNGTGGILGERAPSLPGGSAAGDESGTVPATAPPTAMLALVALVLVGAVALVVRASGDDVSVPDPDASSSGPTDVAAVGRAAGRAADRLEGDEPVENEVYRAWREMTRHLEVPNPGASTPTEFADSAVAAGMAREDVEALTDLFEEVRYGAHEATTEREERAVAALRRLEAAYADGVDADGADASRANADEGAGAP